MEHISSGAAGFSKSEFGSLSYCALSLITGIFLLAFFCIGMQVYTSLSRDEWFRYQEERPILALPGTDIPSLSRSIDYLESGLPGLVSGTYSPKERAAVRSTLYPLEFLKLLPELETRRRALSEKRTAIDTLLYHRTLLETLHAYEGSVSAYRTNLAALPKSLRFGLPAGYTTISHVTYQLQLLEMQARDKREQLTRSRLCGNPLIKTACPEEAKHFVREWTDPPLSRPPSEVARATLKAIYANDPLVRSSYSPIFFQNRCSSEEEKESPVFILYVSSTKDKTLVARKMQDASNLFIRDMNRATTTPFFKTLTDQGLRFEHQFSGHSYLCPDYGEDAADASRILGLQYAIARIRESHMQLTPDTAEAFRAFETRPSLQRAYTVVGALEQERYEREQPREEQKLLENALLTFYSGSFEFESLVAEIALENEFAARMADAGTPQPYRGLFFTRSGLSTLFMVGNRTLITDEPQFFNLKTSVIPPQFSFLVLTELPREKIPFFISAMRAARCFYLGSWCDERSKPH